MYSYEITTPVVAKRGCGYRKPGGFYLVGGLLDKACDLFPIDVHVCPVCGQGVRPSRAVRWIDGDELIAGASNKCKRPSNECCGLINRTIGKALLIWIGEKFYPSSHAFLNEASAQGISRRISAIPRGFVPGETWVFLAHKNAAVELSHIGKAVPKAAIFAAFVPKGIEYIVHPKDDEEKLQSIYDRGITLCRDITPAEMQTELFVEEEVQS